MFAAVAMMTGIALIIMDVTGEKVDSETTIIMAILLAGWIAHKED